MGVLYSIGNTLVSREELAEKAALGRLEEFSEATSVGRMATLDFTTGTVSTDDMAAGVNGALPFEPVGLGRPLTVEILAAYTGDAPGRSFFDRIAGRSKPDLLVVSGAKTPKTFGASPRAINQIVKDVEDKEMHRPGALREGSPIVYYSPAIVDATTYVSVEMVADTFNGDFFDQLQSLFTAAAGLPVFAPAAPFLLAGSAAARIGKKAAAALSESKPFLKADEDLRFDSAAFAFDNARLMVFAKESDLSKLAGHTPLVVEEAGNQRVKLIHKQSGEEYKGSAPFVIASLDGRERPEYADFEPHHASAALIHQFYGGGRPGRYHGGNEGRPHALQRPQVPPGC